MTKKYFVKNTKETSFIVPVKDENGISLKEIENPDIVREVVCVYTGVEVSYEKVKEKTSNSLITLDEDLIDKFILFAKKSRIGQIYTTDDFLIFLDSIEE